MKLALTAESINTILLDIEGTTTPVDFVYKTLFPFARLRIRQYLTAHLSDEEMRPVIQQFREEHLSDETAGLNPPALNLDSQPDQIETLGRYIDWLMDRDRKSTPLKTLQGVIWQAGYLAGELLGEVFADVPTAFKRWHHQGIKISIYSSGSVLAQKLIFAHTAYGDLTGFIDANFDTNIGGKREAESYRRIAESLNYPPSNILFISDVVSELDAAQAAGFQTLCSVRPENQPLDSKSTHPIIHSFDEVL
jgi:enolase-phosphatase E1